jgi:ADP-ribose pyrophosphatase YjhB (NUDIX family)
MDYPGVGTGVLIQNEKGEILMGLRKKWQLWSFPGGKLDMFESLEKCAERERSSKNVV